MQSRKKLLPSFNKHFHSEWRAWEWLVRVPADGLVHTEVISLHCAFRDITTPFYSSSSFSRVIADPMKMLELFYSVITHWQSDRELMKVNQSPSHFLPLQCIFVVVVNGLLKKNIMKWQYTVVCGKNTSVLFERWCDVLQNQVYQRIRTMKKERVCVMLNYFLVLGFFQESLFTQSLKS